MEKLVMSKIALDENVYATQQTKIKLLKQRMPVVEDLQEDTEMMPEKFVTEESFDS